MLAPVAASPVITLVYPRPVENAIQIEYYFDVEQVRLVEAQTAAATASLAVRGMLAAVDESSANTACIFFVGVNYTSSQSAETVDAGSGNGSGANNSGGQTSGITPYVAIAGVAGVLLVVVLVILVVRRGRRQPDDVAGFSLGKASAGNVADFANPLVDNRFRGVAFDCPTYDFLGSDADEEDVEDDTASLSRVERRPSAAWLQA